MDPQVSTLLERFQSIGDVSAIVATVIGATIGAGANFLANFATRAQRTKITREADENFQALSPQEPSHANQSGPGSPGTVSLHTADSARITAQRSVEIIKNQVRSRLREIIEERERKTSLEKWLGMQSGVLTFGQYIIGAMLASSFIQDTVSKTWLGIFGLLVILCSAAKQHFRPDKNAESAGAAAKGLRALIRNAQDRIAILEARSAGGEDCTAAFVALLNEVTQGLSRIEMASEKTDPGEMPAQEPAPS